MFDIIFSTLLLIAILILIIRCFFGPLTGRPIIIYEYEKGVLFRKGLPIKALGAGKHHIFLDHSQVVSVDTRSVKVSFKYTSLSKDKKFIDYEVIAMARVDQPIAYIMNSG